MGKTFDELLSESAAAHGHLCAGQVIGVRMAMAGVSLLGYQAPLTGRQLKDVVIFVEIDRCAADALSTTAGVRLGRRSLKFRDYGVMAATFVRLSDRLSYRLSVSEDSRRRAEELYPDLPKAQREELAYRELPEDELFTIQEVEVVLEPEDLPGWKGHKAVCSRCGAVISFGREIQAGGRTLCRPCAGESYFRPLANRADRIGFDTPALADMR